MEACRWWEAGKKAHEVQYFWPSVYQHKFDFQTYAPWKTNFVWYWKGSEAICLKNAGSEQFSLWLSFLELEYMRRSWNVQSFPN